MLELQQSLKTGKEVVREDFTYCKDRVEVTGWALLCCHREMSSPMLEKFVSRFAAGPE